MTEPRRRTVDDIANPYGNFLTPLPRLVPGVCGVCRRGVTGAYDTCFKCGKESLGVGSGGADAVAMIALAPQQNQLAYELTNYKREATSSGMRDRFTVGLAAVLWKWLAQHESCVAAAAGVTGFPILALVPASSSGRAGEHPLVRLATRVVIGSGERYRSLLAPSAVAPGPREFSPNRFRALTALSGEAVLVVDDTWTTGAHAHGAAAALKAAGAGAVAVVAIGRWYHPDDAANDRAEKHLRARSWSWDECMLER